MEKKQLLDDTYSVLNKKWKIACRTLLGKEVGELASFSSWLAENAVPKGRGISYISGKPVDFSVGEYCSGAKAVQFGEVEFMAGATPLSINEIKDLDSLVQAIGERAVYAGNVVLGNSKFVEGSSSVIDSFYVLDSNMISESKHVAYSSIVKNSENVFGANLEDYSQFLVRGFDTYKNVRCFEVWSTYLCSDAYYMLRCENCHDCMFSFNLLGGRYMVGNLELPREKYLEIKGKLISELRETLVKEKRLPSLMEIVKSSDATCGTEKKREVVLKGAERIEREDATPMEDAWQKTSEMVFGKKLLSMDDYGGWLERHVKTAVRERSALSGRKTLCGKFFPFVSFPRERLVTLEEGLAAGKILRLTSDETCRMTLHSAHKIIGKIAYFPSHIMLGENFNIIGAMMGYKAQNCYNGGIFSNTKFSGFSHFARNSDYMWGSTLSYNSNFCINCYNSNAIARSFEIDSCFNCSSSYFLHNCENVRESMFCFGVKNRKNCIGNAELDAATYAKLKCSLCEQMWQEISAKKCLKWDIYNVGCGKA